MIGCALRDGFRSATRRPGLVALLWAWNLALALLVTLPFWRWVAGASTVSPETDVLLDGFDIGLITQLVATDARVVPSLVAAVAGVLALSLASGALLAGGILEVVTTTDDRPLLHRFFRGAGHFVGRFLRLLVIGGITLVVCAGAAAAGAAAVARAVSGNGREAISFWASIGVVLVVGLVVAFFLVALDYARILAVLGDERRMLRTWWRAMRLVVRRTGAAATIALLAALGIVAAIAVCVAFDSTFSARSWMVIVGAIVIQQAMAFGRTAVRVGQWSAEASYARALQPAPAGVAPGWPAPPQPAEAGIEPAHDLAGPPRAIGLQPDPWTPGSEAPDSAPAGSERSKPE